MVKESTTAHKENPIHKRNRPPTFPIKALGLSRREVLRRAAGAGALLSLSSLGLGIPASADTAEAEVTGKFPKHPQWKFVFVNLTTDPFSVPLRYGAQDAWALFGTAFERTGSEKSIATAMLDAFNTAVSGKADVIVGLLFYFNTAETKRA